MKTNSIILGDAYELIKDIPDSSIDLIVTDPPYLIKNTVAGGHNDFSPGGSKSIQGMNDELANAENLTEGITDSMLDEFMRVMKKPNIYIWCNGAQIPQYIDYFVRKHGCKFDIIIWNKTNAMPLFNNKYLTDKEYCLYFRKGGLCQPKSYERAKTVYSLPINSYDKSNFGHPTIKPLDIIEATIENSSLEGGGCVGSILRKRDDGPRLQASRKKIHMFRDRREIPQDSHRKIGRVRPKRADEPIGYMKRRFIKNEFGNIVGKA